MTEALATEKRGPGRPPQTEVPLKKGRSTWKPANVLDILDKEPGYRYRVAEKSARNIAKKQREGWEIVSAINSPNTDNKSIGNGVDLGKQMGSVLDGHDYIIMRIPEDMAQERDDYFNGESSRRMSALKRQTTEEFSKIGKDGAPVHGSITIEKKGIRNIIKD